MGKIDRTIHCVYQCNIFFFSVHAKACKILVLAVLSERFDGTENNVQENSWDVAKQIPEALYLGPGITQVYNPMVCRHSWWLSMPVSHSREIAFCSTEKIYSATIIRHAGKKGAIDLPKSQEEATQENAHSLCRDCIFLLWKQICRLKSQLSAICFPFLIRPLCETERNAKWRWMILFHPQSNRTENPSNSHHTYQLRHINQGCHFCVKWQAVPSATASLHACKSKPLSSIAGPLIQMPEVLCTLKWLTRPHQSR